MRNSVARYMDRAAARLCKDQASYWGRSRALPDAIRAGKRLSTVGISFVVQMGSRFNRNTPDVILRRLSLPPPLYHDWFVWGYSRRDCELIDTWYGAVTYFCNGGILKLSGIF